MKKIFLALFIIVGLLCFNQTFAWISLSPLKYEFELNTWTSKKEKIKVTNTWDETITIYSSKQDFVSWDDRWTPKFIDSSDILSSEFILSNWINVESNNITLAPKETKEVSFNISVPNNAEPGWHYAAIFFSPWTVKWWQIAVLQRIWVLILVNVPWEVKIDWTLKDFRVWEKINLELKQKDKFDDFPIVFETQFENGWNIHIKPKWKIELIDENWEILKNVWKEVLANENWTYLGEKMVDYIPVNDQDWNVLPRSSRIFENVWEWFGYNILNEDWTKSVKFKNLTQYYEEKAVENAQYLMFWQKVNTRTSKKEITAKYDLYYEWKDKVKKTFNWEKKFNITYEEKYVWLNYYLLILLFILIIGWWYYIKFIHPKQKQLKEQKLREQILNELNKNNN